MDSSHFLGRRWATDPPALQTKSDMNPTLIVSWFCTILSFAIILIRLFGRWVRTERLFREDKVMALSIIPLFTRMAFAHVVLIWGTNNTVAAGLSPQDVLHRQTGSKMVLASRIFYAAYIWIAKVTVLEFTQRIVSQTQTRIYEIGSKILYGFLGLTFAAVFIATLAECQPFYHYWQVVPDPGPACRTGAAQLMTMGVCDIVTDIVLIVFPIPLVWMSNMRFTKKVSLVILFLLSLILIAITAYRIPSTINRHFSQQYRSLLASLEILAATCVSNIIVIGSFLRDKGVKKAKFRAASMDGSTLDRQNTLTRTKSASIAQAQWGSDEDLVRDLGLTVTPSLRHNSLVQQTSRVAPPAEAVANHYPSTIDEEPTPRQSVGEGWTFQKSRTSRRRRGSDSSSNSSVSSDLKLQDLAPISTNEAVSPGENAYTDGKGGFFDIGGLMDVRTPPSNNSASPVQTANTSRSRAFLSDVGGLFSPKPQGEDEIRPAPATNLREFLLQDSAEGSEPPRGRSPSPFARLSGSHRGTPTQSRLRNSAEPIAQAEAGPDTLNISDAGGLLR